MSLTPPSIAAPAAIQYWQMRLIMSTIRRGGNITPQLHVPAMVWHQFGAKITGLRTKISAFQRVFVVICEQCDPLTVPSRPDDYPAFLRAVQAFRRDLCEIQNALARPFNFVPEVKTDGGRSHKSHVKAGSSISSLGLQVAGFVVSVTDSVRRGAATVVERVGTMAPARASDDDMENYADFVYKVCDKCQLFDRWCLEISALVDKEAHARRSVDGVARAVHRGHGRAEPTTQDLYNELRHISKFMEQTVAEIIIRDVEQLCQRYLRKMRKSFVRMYWDDDMLDQETLEQSHGTARATGGEAVELLHHEH